MSETAEYAAPGRSLLAEMTTLREEMVTIRKAFLLLVELQKEANKKLDALNGRSSITLEDVIPNPSFIE